jgi:hypothetical protein
MTMLTHARAPFERARRTSGKRDTAETAAARAHLQAHLQAHLATIKRFCMTALTVVAAGTVLVAIMALKVAIYLPRVTHH